MAKNYREKEQEYERTGQFDRDLNDEHRTFDARDIGDGYNYLTKTFGERLRRFFLLPAVKAFGTVAAFFGLGFKVKGKKNARAVKGGAISVCNHAHELDTLLIKLALGCRRTYHTGSYYLLKKGWAGRIFKAGGFLPVGTSVKDLQNLQNTVQTLLSRDKIVNFYPEHALWRRYEKVRPFKAGAFRYAVKFDVPVIPVFIEFRETKLRKIFRRKKKVVMHILPAVCPDKEGPVRARAEALMQRVHAAMEEKYAEVYRRPMVFVTGEEGKPAAAEAAATA